MPRENESAVLDSARVHLTRLTDALERGTGPGRSRRTLPRLIASLVVASLSCAGCVGYSYVSNNLDSLRRTTTTTTDGTSPEAPSPAPDTDTDTDASTDTDTETRRPLTRDEENGYGQDGEGGYGGSGDGGDSAEGYGQDGDTPYQERYEEPGYPDPGTGAGAGSETDPHQEQDPAQDQDAATGNQGEPAPEDPAAVPGTDSGQDAREEAP
ncbi:hypothetical protein [Actinomyces wuliandei]|uniref:hypothetical protein n=1 Tax=Actinomyces wuliandei TaxID=2057743 RepID=UPI000FDA0975|nr:hypothetical protein [Actinomyces wuliandei]